MPAPLGAAILPRMPSIRAFAPLLPLTALLAAAWPLGAAATCYTVYDTTNRVVFQATEPPVNMARELHDTVPARFGPGATMVFSLNASDNCPGIGAGAGLFTGPTEGYMANGARTFNADYIRSPSEGKPSAGGNNASR